MGRTTTPYAGAFFAMVGIGGAAGAVVPIVLMIIEFFTTASFNLPAMMIGSILGFFIGLVLAGSGAGPAVGLHALAEAKVPALRVPGAVVGAMLGPILLAWAVAGGAWWSLAAPAVLIPALVASAATAVWVTRPLRVGEKLVETAPDIGGAG